MVVFANIYARFSPRKDAENCQSIEMQLELCRKYCEAHGYVIAGEYADPDVSGGDEDRPALWNAVDALKRDWVLVAYRADRIARSVYLSEYIHREVAKKRARVEVVDGSRNGETPEDVLMRQVFAAFAEYERKLIAVRTKAAALRHQANGWAVGNEPPYGMAIGPSVESRGKLRRTLVVNEAEQAVIRHVLGLYDGGAGLKLRAIARQLNDEGVASRGAKWTHTAVGRVVKRNGLDGANGSKTVAQDAPRIVPTGSVEV